MRLNLALVADGCEGDAVRLTALQLQQFTLELTRLTGGPVPVWRHSSDPVGAGARAVAPGNFCCVVVAVVASRHVASCTGSCRQEETGMQKFMGTKQDLCHLVLFNSLI